MTLSRSRTSIAGTVFGLGATFVAAFLVAGQCLPHLHLRSALYPRQQVIPPFERPGSDHFFLSAIGHSLDQETLFHALGPSIEHARNADVLFFGSSRMQLGLRGEVLVPAATTLGVDMFSLGSAHNERARFALEVIRKHDLRPKVMVVSGGPHVFTNGVSAIAAQAMRSSRWDSWKHRFEVRAAWALRSRLHAKLPKLDFLNQNIPNRWIIYRSERTGWWRPVHEPNRNLPFTLGEDWETYRPLMPLATNLHEELQTRGIQLVLTMVPYLETLSGHLPYLAEQLDVPYVLPPFDHATLADGAHLDRASAQRYARAFWDRFIVVPEVQEALGLPSRHNPD